MQGKHETDTSIRTEVVRPERARCEAEGRAEGEASSQRTGESVRAEEAYRDWSEAPPSQRPIAAHRLTVASELFALLKQHGVSKLRLALMVGVDDKTIRKWLDGRAPVPASIVLALPTDMALDFLARMAALRGCATNAAAEIAKLSTRVELRAAQRALLERDEELSRGDR